MGDSGVNAHTGDYIMKINRDALIEAIKNTDRPDRLFELIRLLLEHQRLRNETRSKLSERG